MRRNKSGEEEYSSVEEEANQRIVIIRGQLGEVVINSSNPKDTLDNMARLARDQYEKGSIPIQPPYVQ